MKNKFIAVLAVFILCGLAPAHAQNLDAVLSSMDRAAASFRSAQCDFLSDQYQKVVDDHDTQKGKMYFRRQGSDVQMAADFAPPEQKYVLFTGSLLSVYQPSINQVTQYSPGKNKGDFESFLVLGFGGSGQDLAKSFDVKYSGMEQVQGVSAAKLELTPKSQRVRNMFSAITLWIDPARGISVQQRYDEPSGDYKLTKFSNIELNHKISDDVFKLKTNSHTTVVKPNS